MDYVRGGVFSRSGLGGFGFFFSELVLAGAQRQLASVFGWRVSTADCSGCVAVFLGVALISSLQTNSVRTYYSAPRR